MTNASQRIDEKLRSLGGWRGEALAEVRRLIVEADPDVVEGVKSSAKIASNPDPRF